jgi:hypothetical protein
MGVILSPLLVSFNVWLIGYKPMENQMPFNLSYDDDDDDDDYYYY